MGICFGTARVFRNGRERMERNERTERRRRKKTLEGVVCWPVFYVTKNLIRKKSTVWIGFIRAPAFLCVTSDWSWH